MMKIKPISFPFVRIRLCDVDYKVEKFFDLPDFELTFKPTKVENPTEAPRDVPMFFDRATQRMQPYLGERPGSSPWRQGDEPLKRKIPVMVERFLRQNNVTIKEVLPMVKKAIDVTLRSPDFVEQYGTLELHAPQVQITAMLEGQRYYSGIRSWRDRESGTCTNSFALEMGRGASFVVLAGNERPHRVPEHHMITGRVTAFGSRSPFAISHSFVNLRGMFTEEYITEAVMSEVKLRFPFMIESDLFKDFVLEEF